MRGFGDAPVEVGKADRVLYFRVGWALCGDVATAEREPWNAAVSTFVVFATERA